MAKVKILLEPGETELDAHEALSKALEIHNNGDTHVKESFEDPAMIHLSQRMDKIHEMIYKDMVQEIIDELDKEFM